MDIELLYFANHFYFLLCSLALCELHLALAALALRVLPRMALYETTERDVVYDYDSKSIPELI